MELKIGILLPRSDMFPALGMNFLNGLKLSLKGLNSSEVSIKFIVEGVGNAADDTVFKAIEKLILQEEIELLIGFCSISKLHELTQIINTYKKPFIHIDLGGSILKNECTSPYILHHTLGLCQSSYAAGKYAATNFGKKGFIASSFYDGGYQLVESFVRGYSGEGGEIDKYYVSPMDYKNESFDTLIEGLEETKPDVLFAIFSYKEGIKVFDILANSRLNGNIPIIAIPLMTDETINVEDYTIKNVSSVASWAFDDSEKTMQDFNKEYEDAYKESPNILGLLGFEVGLTILECLSSEGNMEPQLSKKMKGKTIVSPRGKLSYNNMNESQTESFKLRKFKFINTKYHNTVIGVLDASFSEKLYSEFESIPYTGWKNPYICT